MFGVISDTDGTGGSCRLATTVTSGLGPGRWSQAVDARLYWLRRRLQILLLTSSS